MPLIQLILLLLLVQQHVEGTKISWRNIDDGFIEAKKKNLPAVVVIHKSCHLDLSRRDLVLIHLSAIAVRGSCGRKVHSNDLTESWGVGVTRRGARSERVQNSMHRKDVTLLTSQTCHIKIVRRVV